MALKQKTEENITFLLRCMDPSHELLGRLRSVTFVKDHVSAIKQKSTVDDKNDALLELLLEAPEDIQESVIYGFISALRSSGQEHVANIFRRESDKVPMSDEHYHALTVNKGQLCQFIDTENGLLGELVSMEVISHVDENDIRSMLGYNEKARKLTEVLMRKSDNAFDGFIQTLNQTGQSHVTYLLTGEGSSRPLSEECRTNLREKRAAVVKSIYPECLVSTLVSKGVFSSYDQQRVEAQKTSNGRGETMIDLIGRKSQAAYDGFVATLFECHHEHVAEELIGAEVCGNIEPQVCADNVEAGGVEVELCEKVQQTSENGETEIKQLNEVLHANGVSVSEVRHGSIIVKFRCRDHAAVLALRELYSSKRLDQLFSESFCPTFADKGLQSLILHIPDEEFQRHMQLKLMTDEHREALLSSEERLLVEMRVSDDLLDKLSLCKRRRQAIEQATTQEQQVKTLLDIVSRRPDSAFDQLLNALRATDQHEVAAVVSGDSRTAEMHKICTEEAWNNVDRDLEYLLNLIIKAELGYLDETFRPAFYSICVASRGVAMSLHNLREHYSVPTSRISMNEEAEHMEHTPEIFSPQAQQSIEWPVGLHHYPGEHFLLSTGV